MGTKRQQSTELSEALPLLIRFLQRITQHSAAELGAEYKSLQDRRHVIKRRLVIGLACFVSRCALAISSVNKVPCIRWLCEELAPLSVKSVFTAKETADIQAVVFYFLVSKRSSS